MPSLAIAFPFFLLFSTFPAFNIDLPTAVRHYMADLQPDAFYGFSVTALLDQNTPSVLVGAPRARTVSGVSSGRIFKCNGLRNWCRRVPVQESRDGRRAYGHQAGRWTEQWLGGEVATGSKAWNGDGVMVMCAPRFQTFGPEVNATEPLAAVGECSTYLGRRNVYRLIYPCNQPDEDSCIAGMSASVADHPTKTLQLIQIALGMPGSFMSEGNVFLGTYRETGEEVNRVRLKAPGDWTKRGFGLGYSVVLANLLPREKESNNVVVACPWWVSNGYRGVVIITDEHMNTNEAILCNDTLGHVASFFGHSLAVLDLNADGVMDIVVGAPFFTKTDDHKYDVGRVYVYFGRSHDGRYATDREPTILEGPEVDGRFGHSVLNAGDLDRDGANDLLVGCPGCGPDKQGAVFIFHGSRGGRMSTKPSQVISAAELSSAFTAVYTTELILAGETPKPTVIPPLKLFGSSMSGRVDFDNNGFVDLVVGSFPSNSVLYLRSKPTGRVVLVNSSVPPQLKLSRRECRIRDCSFLVEFTIRLQSSTAKGPFPFRLTFDFDSSVNNVKEKRMAWVNPDTGKEEEPTFHSLTVNAAENMTRRFQMKLRPLLDRVERNKWLPLRVRVNITHLWSFDYSASPVSDSNLKPSPLPLVLFNDTLRSFALRDIPILNEECLGTTCDPDLAISLYDTSGSELQSGILYFGERRKARNLTVMVVNYGDPAYMPRIVLDFPYGVSCEPSSRCSPESEFKQDGVERIRISCPLFSPLRRNTRASLSFILSPSNVLLTEQILKKQSISIVARAESDNADSDIVNNRQTLIYTILVFSRVDMALRSTGSTVFDTRNSTVRLNPDQRLNTDVIGPGITHVYSLTNFGPSPVKTAHVNVSLPLMTESGDFLLYLMESVKEPVRGGFRVADTMPRVVGDRGEQRGSCHVDPRYLNPLRLIGIRTPDRGVVVTRNRARRSADVEEVDGQMASSSWSFIPSVRPKQQEVIRCGSSEGEFANPFCITVQCTIHNITKNEVLRIVVDAWLWSYTFFRYKTSDLLVHTEISGALAPTAYGLPVSNYRVLTPLSMSQSVIFTGIVTPVTKQIALWPIILAVVLGLIALLIIVGLLWMCGFFKRKRRIDWEDKPTEL